VAAAIASGSSADLALCHVVADGVFRFVCMKWNFGTIEDDEQFSLVGEQALEEFVELGEAGALLEYGVEAGFQFGLGAARRGVLVGDEVAVEVPDLAAHRLLSGAIGFVEGVELVNQPLGVNPAQRVKEPVDLPGVVTEDHGHGEEAVRQDRAQQGAFGGDLRRIGVGFEFAYAEPAQMRAQSLGAAEAGAAAGGG